jgi:SAM-dependent methyltransferase
VERARLSTRGEASRALAWCREAAAERDLTSLVRLGLAGASNVGAAATDRWRPARWWCPCCERSSGAFLSVANRLRTSRHAVCPACGSRSRHRGLVLALDRVVQLGEVRSVLHFAPEAPLLGPLRRALPDARHVTTDLHRRDVDAPGEDIQALSFPDGGFDLVVCNHVLEHVADDRRAMAELARVTAPGGVVLLTLPGDWSRRQTVTFADTSLNGHHRDYGTDVVDQLVARFAEVDVLVFGELDLDADRPGRAGLRPDDRVFACRP